MFIIMNCNKSKSFTLIEVIVVMGVLGLILGGLMVSLRQVIEEEMLLKRMQAVEEESRFIMDLFAQDAQYSELGATFKPSGEEDIVSIEIPFNLVEKKSSIAEPSLTVAKYDSYPIMSQYGNQFFLRRNIIVNEIVVESVTLNNTPLQMKPYFRIKRLVSPDGAENYLVTISLIFRVENKDNPVFVPIQTSVVSRTFEI